MCQVGVCQRAENEAVLIGGARNETETEAEEERHTWYRTGGGTGDINQHYPRGGARVVPTGHCKHQKKKAAALTKAVSTIETEVANPLMTLSAYLTTIATTSPPMELSKIAIHTA